MLPERCRRRGTAWLRTLLYITLTETCCICTHNAYIYLSVVYIRPCVYIPVLPGVMTGADGVCAPSVGSLSQSLIHICFISLMVTVKSAVMAYRTEEG